MKNDILTTHLLIYIQREIVIEDRWTIDMIKRGDKGY